MNKDGNIVNQNELEVDEELTIHYIYRNNTDCTVYVNGYNSEKQKIDGIYEIPARGKIEVVGNTFIVPNKRDFSVWGGVYLEGVAMGHTSYETNGTNNAWALKQAEKNVENNIKINKEIARAVKWLDEYGIVFEEYDDVVVRRLVDTIRVNSDDTITVYLKGGVEITENIK